MTAIEIGLKAISLKYGGSLCEYCAESVVPTNMPDHHIPFTVGVQYKPKVSNNFQRYILQRTEHPLTAWQKNQT